MKTNTNNCIHQPTQSEYNLVSDYANRLLSANLTRVLKFKYGTINAGCRAIGIKANKLHQIKVKGSGYIVSISFVFRCCILLNCLPGELLSPLTDSECKTIAARNNSFFSLCGLKE
jgi:DNA-binding Xre family transcriptional regulator